MNKYFQEKQHREQSVLDLELLQRTLKKNIEANKESTLQAEKYKLQLIARERELDAIYSGQTYIPHPSETRSSSRRQLLVRGDSTVGNRAKASSADLTHEDISKFF